MAELAAFEEQRGRLWGIAYRLTGSVMDADDAVQEAWLRWQALPDGAADNPRAYLTTVVSRICYDRLGSARARRETYPGPWLPEPVVTDPGPEERATLDESVGLALLAVLERLTPAERTAFVLHDVFGVPFPQIAEVVGRSPQAVRQLASRARGRVRDQAPHRSADRAEHRRVVDAFLTAAAGGDLAALARVLDPDVVWHSDGGGRVTAARVPVAGAERVLRLLAGIARQYDPETASLLPRDVNGAPGVVFADRSRGLVGVFALTVHEGRITRVDLVVNPDKLRHVAPRFLP
ncbi:RNA polymerase sigma factor SigJ [Streptomyces sp. TRM 70361]|uniref:RNA polymerase sigma factor SigJ n=1 Tax=Streptomyces sp. TRM 70361 TaxID=3116553 RepID=UPI002E7BBAC6|nr:RNA polymerase sigma factor SigJ [Streptomyces sp. TRM 70361]MEE1940698.1 RNA polymerase sigma factor SigJ [Streptomyces sp. TRM 70361]